jgi:hypothetical protein
MLVHALRAALDGGFEVTAAHVALEHGLVEAVEAQACRMAGAGAPYRFGPIKLELFEAALM